MVLGPGDEPPVRIELSLLWFTSSVVLVKADQYSNYLQVLNLSYMVTKIYLYLFIRSLLQKQNPKTKKMTSSRKYRSNS